MVKNWTPSSQPIAPLLQLFPDLKEEAQAEYYYPMYPINSVELPVAGPDFIAEAERRSGMPPPKGFGKTTDYERTYFVEYLEALYRAALYNFPFQISVNVKNQIQPKPVQFVPGGLWEDNDEAIAGGPVSAKIMLIGKHPGWDEASTGRNFSGPTSQVLVRALNELGVTDSNTWYMTNIVKFPPPDSGSQVLPVSWVKDCLPILHQEFRLVHPDYVLLLGDDAIKAVLGRTRNLGNTAGQVIEIKIPRHERATETPVWHTMKVMTAPHPARIYRQPDLYPMFYGAVKLFIELTEGKAVGQIETDLEQYVLKNEEEVKAWVDLVLAEKATMFALDCEWHGRYPADKGSFLRTVQVAWGPKKAACILLRSATGETFEGHWLPYLTKLLKNTSDHKVRIVGHNLKADLPWLIHAGLDLRPEFEAPPDDPDPDGKTRLYGWQKTATEGGIDTMVGVHAWQETHPLGLEACTSQLLGMPRYDLKLEEWKTDYCKQKKISKSDLEGYGDVPDEILIPYAIFDAIGTWRLAELLNKPGGLLDSDRFGYCSRKPFWVTMRALPAFMEMEANGVNIDKARAENLTDSYRLTLNKKLEALRILLRWPAFNPNSSRHKIEALFGEKYHSARSPLRPAGAVSLKLQPLKATGKRPVMWTEVQKRVAEKQAQIADFSPSTDKETLGIISSQPNAPAEVKLLRDINFLNQVLRTVLRPPKTVAVSDTEEQDDIDEGGNKIYDSGLLSFVNDDGRVRSMFFPTCETGRARSSSPNLQNLGGKRREGDYGRILGDLYSYPIRSIICASPGCVLLEADYTAAEVAAVAWMSCDPTLIEHSARALLPESHPEYFDIHSYVATKAFKLSCKPTKAGLKSINKTHLRTAAKTVFFGYLYGQGAEAACRNARQEGASVTVTETQALIDGLTKTYPGLAIFFSFCKQASRNPGYLVNCFGRRRRFGVTTDRQILAENERQGCNFMIQSLVADAVSRALDYLYKARQIFNVKYKIVLQVHDAIMLDVPIQYLETVYEKVIPTCMCQLVDIWPTDTLGNIKSNITKPYHLGCGRDVYLNWGEEISFKMGKILDIPEKYCASSAPDNSGASLMSQPGWREIIQNGMAMNAIAS